MKKFPHYPGAGWFSLIFIICFISLSVLLIALNNNVFSRPGVLEEVFLENTCVIDAKQAAARLPEGTWNRILLVNIRGSNGLINGHAYLIFEEVSYLFAWDASGTQPLRVKADDSISAMEVASIISDEIVSCGWIGEEMITPSPTRMFNGL